MEAPATGVHVSTSSPKDYLEQASNATQGPSTEIVSNLSEAVAGDFHTTCASEVHLVSCQTVSHSPEDMEVDTISLGIGMAMSYVDESFTGTQSNEASPSDGKVAPSGVIEISGPSTIDEKKRKKRNMKKPRAPDDLFKLVVTESVELFYKKYLGNWIIKANEIAKLTIVLDINGYVVNYKEFY